MWIFNGFIKNTTIGGLLFLVPVAVILIVIGRLVSFLRPTAERIAGVIGPVELGPFLLVAIIALALIAVAFGAGLLASTIIGHKTVDWLERAVLNRVPGYSIVKSAAADAARNLGKIEASGQAKAVYVRSGEGWQVGFVMEKIDEDTYAIFTPDAPTPSSGPLMLVAADQFVESNLTTSEALDFLMRLGAGGAPGKHPRDSLARSRRRMDASSGETAAPAAPRSQ